MVRVVLCLACCMLPGLIDAKGWAVPKIARRAMNQGGDAGSCIVAEFKAARAEKCGIFAMGCKAAIADAAAGEERQNQLCSGSPCVANTACLERTLNEHHCMDADVGKKYRSIDAFCNNEMSQHCIEEAQAAAQASCGSGSGSGSGSGGNHGAPTGVMCGSGAREHFDSACRHCDAHTADDNRCDSSDCSWNPTGGTHSDGGCEPRNDQNSDGYGSHGDAAGDGYGSHGDAAGSPNDQNSNSPNDQNSGDDDLCSTCNNGYCLPCKSCVGYETWAECAECVTSDCMQCTSYCWSDDAPTGSISSDEGSPNDQNSGSPNDQNSGSPNDQNSGSPNDQNSGSPNDQSSGSPNDQNSNSPNDQNSGNDDLCSTCNNGYCLECRSCVGYESSPHCAECAESGCMQCTSYCWSDDAATTTGSDTPTPYPTPYRTEN